MNSRDRVTRALNHEEPDQVPLDLGSTAVTGMHVSSVYLLRQAMGLDRPGTPVRVVEPYQMLGEIGPDLMEALGVDVVPVGREKTFFGFKNEGWKPWALFDGTPVLVPEDFNTEPEPSGDILMYPEGDKSVAPSGRMPKGGFYFDSIIRQEPIDDDNLNVDDNLEEFGPISDEELGRLATSIEDFYSRTDKAIVASLGDSSFGDIAFVPGPGLKAPKGIRDVAEWYMSTVARREYVYQIFEKQCEIALANLDRLNQVSGDKVSVIFISGTDFGTQRGLFISPKAYRDLYQPFLKQVNGWVHEHTSWKTFIHTCGSIQSLIDDFIETGFDILNPVQCSAADMEPRDLKAKFGDRVTFWGGGVDTQHTLPFGTPDDVRREVKERIEVFGPGGGFVFNTIHNVQANVPVENLLALYETFKQYRGHFK